MYGYFMQAIITAYTAKFSVTALQKVFSIQLVPSDLNVHDFYLWICMNSPHFLHGLNNSIKGETANISSQDLCFLKVCIWKL